MSKLIRRTWPGSGATGLPRRDRRPCSYAAYLPDPLHGRNFVLDGEVAADVTEAETAIARLNLKAAALSNTEALARLLLRAESVASSRIEGLEVGGRRLLRAEVAENLGERSRDVTAEEVLGNIRAMTWSATEISPGEALSLQQLLNAHRRLLEGTNMEAQAGRIRDEQNWIGGSSYNPCSAVFVPPPEDQVELLLEDLCAFCNEESLPAVAQAAIAHAQFETIHPFVDGNGRTGRALTHMVLRRRGLTPRVLPPVSLVLATWARDYVDALMGTRYVGSSSSPEAVEGINRWIGLFAAACKRAVEDAEQFEARVRELQDSWRRRVGKVRANSALDLLIDALPGAPIVTVNSAADLISRSFPAASAAVSRLEQTKVLTQVNVGRKNRAFEATEIVDAFTDLERRLASPDRDTRVSPPARRVPARPRRA